MLASLSATSDCLTFVNKVLDYLFCFTFSLLIYIILWNVDNIVLQYSLNVIKSQ